MLEVDCEIVAGAWSNAVDWQALARRSVAAALAGAGYRNVLQNAAPPVEVAVRLSDDGEVRQLNGQYRAKDQPTNILSFPMQEASSIDKALRQQDCDLLLGDLVLAVETATREAVARGISLEDHVTHLIVHGVLHLLGHDHQDDSAADAMEALETRILAGLGIADPYSDSHSARTAIGMLSGHG